MSAFGTALLLAAEVRVRARAAASINPRKAQERALFRLLRRAERTSFGRAHGFDGIASVAEFRSRVPLHRFEDLRPWFERALSGEPDVSWPGKIPYFGMTSGTTGGNKYLPISPDSVAQQRRGGFESLATYLFATKDRELLAGKGLLLGSTSELERRHSGVLVGDNSGIMARHMPGFVQSKYLPSPGVRKLANWDTKIAAVAREAVHEDVRLIAGTPSWFPGLFEALLNEAERAGKPHGSVSEVWPNLRLLSGGGIAYEPYRPLIERRLGRHVPYIETYNATEGGIMGVADRLGEAPLLILPDNGIFYEFVPLEDFQRDNPRRCALWETELEVPYVLLVSTMSGIFSYAIGDVIRFVERFPHRFLVDGRVQAFLNVQGEHVSQGELERAIRVASAAHQVCPRDFTVGAELGIDGGSAARHVLFVEFDGNVPDLTLFGADFDRELKTGNEDYATHRGTRHGLDTPAVSLLPRGSFEEWMRRRGKHGGQHKVPRLVLDLKARALLETVARELAP